MRHSTLVYPVIFSEFNDDGHYYTVTSPNLPGMITQADTLTEAQTEAVDAIATMLDGNNYPQRQNSTHWQLESNQQVHLITVDMAAWYHEKNEYLKSVYRTQK